MNALIKGIFVVALFAIFTSTSFAAGVPAMEVTDSNGVKFTITKYDAFIDMPGEPSIACKTAFIKGDTMAYKCTTRLEFYTRAAETEGLLTLGIFKSGTNTAIYMSTVKEADLKKTYSDR